eukprot:GHVN01050589.1.p2 GENE.GHVN01050589.1~~GHVN01050589.1.p2  ORF type:complete len:594 (-),score=101.07 GHVN01050589.1:2834-4615(-)
MKEITERCDAVLAEKRQGNVSQDTLNQLSDLLWTIGADHGKAEDYEMAEKWFLIIAQFDSHEDLDTSANIWRAVGICKLKQGNARDALEAATSALKAQPESLPSLMLAFSCAVETGLIAEAEDFLKSITSSTEFTHSVASGLVGECLSHKQGPIAISCLDIWLSKEHERITVMSTETGSHGGGSKKETPADLCHRFLMVMRNALMLSLEFEKNAMELLKRHGPFALELMSKIAPAVIEANPEMILVIGWIGDFCWNAGLSAGTSNDYANCVAALDLSAKLYCFLPLTVERLDAIKMCFIIAASNKLNELREAFDKQEEKERKITLLRELMTCLDEGMAMSKKSASWGKQSDGEDCSAAGGAPQDKCYPVLVLMQFEAKCRFCVVDGEAVSEEQVHSYFQDVSSDRCLKSRCFEVMAGLAGELGLRATAQAVLKHLITLHISNPQFDAKKCAESYRELISLCQSRNESLVLYDEVHLLLEAEDSRRQKQMQHHPIEVAHQPTDGSVNNANDSSSSSHIDANASSILPHDEAGWLVATAWNNGAHCFKMQNFEEAEKWMTRGMSFLKFAPAMAHHMTAMQETYGRCSKRLAAGGC